MRWAEMPTRYELICIDVVCVVSETWTERFCSDDEICGGLLCGDMIRRRDVT